MQLEQLTRDHSLYEEMAAARVPDLMPREQCPFANVITRALGIESEARPQLRTEQVQVVASAGAELQVLDATVGNTHLHVDDACVGRDAPVLRCRRARVRRGERTDAPS